MKKYLFLVPLLVIWAFTSQAQHILTLSIPHNTQKAFYTEASKGIASKNDTSKIATLYNCDNLDQLAKADVKKNPDGSYSFTILGSNDEPVTSFSFRDYDYALFISNLKTSLLTICPDSASVKFKGVVNSLSSRDLFDKMIKASLAVANEGRPAGELKISRTSHVFKDTPDKKNTKLKPGSVFNLFDIQVQFQDGFIENITLHGKMQGNDTLLKFENSYPISFSTKKNFNNLSDIKLYERNYFRKDGNSYIFLGDVLKFDPAFDLNSKDYFPANQTYKARITDSITTTNLLKETTSKILAMEIFTDLNGVSNESPNGLIQIDLSKKINLWTYRFGAKHTNSGYFNYFTPGGTLSKIEDENKYLIVNYYGKSKTDPEKPNTYATSINSLRYEQFKIGGKVNAFLFDVPQFKSTFFFNLGAFFGNTLIQDTIRTIAAGAANFTPIKNNNVVHFSANSFRLVPEFQWEIYPDSRWGVCVTQQFIRYNLLNANINQIDNQEKYLTYLKSSPTQVSDYSFSKWIGATEIKGFFNPSDNNKVFIRYRYNWDMNDGRNNFHQFQVGLLSYLTFNNDPKKSQ